MASCSSKQMKCTSRPSGLSHRIAHAGANPAYGQPDRRFGLKRRIDTQHSCLVIAQKKNPAWWSGALISAKRSGENKANVADDLTSKRNATVRVPVLIRQPAKESAVPDCQGV